MTAQPPPETSERIRIHGDTTKEQCGFVLAELTKLGLANIGFEVIVDVHLFKQRKPRVPKPEKPAKAVASKPKKAKGAKGRGGSHRYEIGNREFILSKCFKGRTEISAEVLGDMFEREGRPRRSAGAALTKLGYEGYVKSMGGGVWKILAKTHKLNGAAPAEATSNG